MNLIFRMVRVFFMARLRSRVDPLAETLLTFTVWPSDVDVLIHMNNGRYLTLMDLGRVDAILRSGIWKALRSRRWYTVVASEAIRFRESLPLFERFELRTRTLGWDEKSFYLRQQFLVRGRVVAVGVVRVRFLKRSGGTLSAAEVAAALMPGRASPALPEYISTWRAAESAYARATSIESSKNRWKALGV